MIALISSVLQTQHFFFFFFFLQSVDPDETAQNENLFRFLTEDHI